ncbi:hypothetical protein Jiend_12030 [Micromonospora endophytica]|nr:hypothetical protein Jiend_12030 [Micromonospora endophytica]
MPVTLDREQAVAFHPGDGLADGGAALAQPFGDPGAQRRHALLLEFEDRAKVHLGRIDQIVRLHGVSGPPVIDGTLPHLERQSSNHPGVAWC